MLEGVNVFVLVGVEVKVEVNNLGNVISTSTKVIEASEDPECLSQIAQEFAFKSVFRGNASAPSNHQAKLTYIFISQE